MFGRCAVALGVSAAFVGSAVAAASVTAPPVDVVAVASPEASLVQVRQVLEDPTVNDAQWKVPTQGAIVDFFRPPAHAYGPGNRGLEFAVDAGTAVTAVGDGVVSFAGQVGRDYHVVVDHTSGLRSGYSHLESVAVVVGEVVATGHEVGRTSSRFHLSARLTPGSSATGLQPWGERRYVDPLPLLGLEVYVRLSPSHLDGR